MQKLLYFFRLLPNVAIYCKKNVYNTNVRYCVHICHAQHRLGYSFFNQRRQTTLSSMHTMQVWVSKAFLCIIIRECVCVCVCLDYTHTQTHQHFTHWCHQNETLNFQNIKTSTLEDLRYSTHALIYIYIYIYFHCLIFAILSTGDTKYIYILLSNHYSR